ncbi:hypothetical protein XENOCAPTIV_019260, partial [Xenoophorus captivus]
NNQIPITSSSSLGGSGSQTSSSSNGFSQLAGLKTGPLGFSFTQPAAAASVSKPTTANSNSASSSLQFSFTKPTAPPGSSSTGPSTEPTTPSSFSFTADSLQARPTLFSSTVSFSHPPAFGDVNPKAESGSDDKESSLKTQDTNVFGRISKATKRKDDPAVSSSGLEKPAVEENAPADVDSPKPPAKRQVMKSRGLTGNLFGRALSGIRKDQVNPVRREAMETLRPALNLEEPEEPHGDDLSATPPTAQTLTRDVVEKSKGSGQI